MSLDLPEWQKSILNAYAKDPEKFKRAILWRPDRGYWKRQVERQSQASTALAALIEGETDDTLLR